MKKRSASKERLVQVRKEFAQRITETEDVLKANNDVNTKALKSTLDSGRHLIQTSFHEKFQVIESMYQHKLAQEEEVKKLFASLDAAESKLETFSSSNNDLASFIETQVQQLKEEKSTMPSATHLTNVESMYDRIYLTVYKHAKSPVTDLEHPQFKLLQDEVEQLKRSRDRKAEQVASLTAQIKQYYRKETAAVRHCKAYTIQVADMLNGEIAEGCPPCKYCENKGAINTRLET